MIIIQLNGESREVPEGWTVSALLENLKVQTNHVAVEVNRRILDRQILGQTTLCQGDQVEVIGFIGGG